MATVGHNWTLSPNLILDGTYGYTRMDQDVQGPDFGANFGLDVLGIPGTNGPDIRQSGMPIFTVGGFTPLGNPNTWSPIERLEESHAFTANMAWTRGNHELRWGFDMVHHRLNHWQPEIGGGPRGQVIFGGGVTSLSGGAAPNQFNNLGAFLLGLPTTMQKSLQFELMTGREWQFAWYLRDRWQVTPSLTLSLGLRYEFYPLMVRDDRGIEKLDFETLQVGLGGVAGNPKRPFDVSRSLFAPRIGLAYRIGDDTVIRSGYGITYNPMPFSRPLRGFFPLTIAESFVGANPFTPFRPLEDGIPEIVGPDLSQGVLDLPPTADMRAIGGERFNRGYIQTWNLVVERALPIDFVASVGYVGSQTVRQLADLNVNAAGPGGGIQGQPFFEEFGRTANTRFWNGWLSSNYHSLQTSIDRHFSDGFFVKGAYTFSRAINRTDDDGWATVMFNHPDVLDRNRALAGFDIPHNFQLAVIYEVPFGRGMNNAAGAILRNWQVNGIVSAFSGQPFTVFASGASLNAPGNSQTADQVNPVVARIGDVGSTGFYFDPAAFAPVTEARFGNSGRNTLRGPSRANLDFSLFRQFPVTEDVNVEFRAEAFNLTNTPHFNNPVNSVESTNFMRITSAADTSRQFRFGLRIIF